MSDKKPHSPNDDRSNVKNPNNPAYDHDAANRSRQDGQGETGTTPAPKADESQPAKRR